MTTTHTPDTYPPSAHDIATVKRFVRRFDRWMAHLAAVDAGTETYNLRLMPSKDAKHRAYGAAAAICRATGQERPTDLEGLRRVVAG
jgi:hypothetical protein